MGEDIDRKKHRKYTQVRCISHMEMINVMLKYPEVVTNMHFIKVSTMPLDLWSGIIVNSGTDTEDGTYTVGAIKPFFRWIDLYGFILHTENQPLILDDLKLSKKYQWIRWLSLVSELQRYVIFDKLGDYCRWFLTSIKVRENM